MYERQQAVDRRSGLGGGQIMPSRIRKSRDYAVLTRQCPAGNGIRPAIPVDVGGRRFVEAGSTVAWCKRDVGLRLAERGRTSLRRQRRPGDDDGLRIART